MNYRVMLPQHERVHILTGSLSKLFEAPALDFMRDEYLALFFGQLIKGSIELFEQ